MKKDFRIIGTMSGTSLDGLDIALCSFYQKNDRWEYKIEKATTFQYNPEWVKKLSTAEELSGLELFKLHNEFGRLTGNCINDFLSGEKIDIDFIASHGHTIFHQPDLGITLQIGSGACIAANTGIPTICDFRSLDVALGGQGAPLVPIGDQLLFSEFAYCLNLGGFANISFNHNNKRVAFDICPVNIVVNYLAGKLGLTFDKNGDMGRKGFVDINLLRDLNYLPFYSMEGPKSLGKEWVLKEFIPILDAYNINIEDKIRTVYEHICIQIQKTIIKDKALNVLVTGGGAHNKFLTNLLQEKIGSGFVVAEKEIIDYKEALIFAFLGLLRFLELPNCLKSSTNSKKDNTGGVIYCV